MTKVMYTVLDWGLGHATRSIPIIRKILERKFEVILAGSGDSLVLLRKEFPELVYEELPAYNPRYPRRGSFMVFKMASQIVRFSRVIKQEHQVLEKLIRKHKIQLVISDNRFGCWSATVRSIFITHQSNIMMPTRFGWLSPWVRRQNLRMMRRFSECWIPDNPLHPLAGSLTQFGKIPGNITVKFIGHLSRFNRVRVEPHQFQFDIVAILSGPEPQRTIFEREVESQLASSGFRYFIVKGKPAGTGTSSRHQDFLSGQQLADLILSSNLVIARSGYSTVMDLAALGAKAIFVPTPGQTEQEYLAKRLKEMKIAFSTSQDNFRVSDAVRESEYYSGFSNLFLPDGLLNKALDNVLNTSSSQNLPHD